MVLLNLLLPVSWMSKNFKVHHLRTNQSLTIVTFSQLRRKGAVRLCADVSKLQYRLTAVETCLLTYQFQVVSLKKLEVKDNEKEIFFWFSARVRKWRVTMLHKWHQPILQCEAKYFKKITKSNNFFLMRMLNSIWKCARYLLQCPLENLKKYESGEFSD
jgi:hypothetical protein